MYTLVALPWILGKQLLIISCYCCDLSHQGQWYGPDIDSHRTLQWLTKSSDTVFQTSSWFSTLNTLKKSSAVTIPIRKVLSVAQISLTYRECFLFLPPGQKYPRGVNFSRSLIQLHVLVLQNVLLLKCVKRRVYGNTSIFSTTVFSV